MAAFHERKSRSKTSCKRPEPATDDQTTSADEKPDAEGGKRKCSKKDCSCKSKSKSKSKRSSTSKDSESDKGTSKSAKEGETTEPESTVASTSGKKSGKSSRSGDCKITPGPGPGSESESCKETETVLSCSSRPKSKCPSESNKSSDDCGGTKNICSCNMDDDDDDDPCGIKDCELGGDEECECCCDSESECEKCKEDWWKESERIMNKKIACLCCNIPPKPPKSRCPSRASDCAEPGPSPCLGNCGEFMCLKIFGSFFGFRPCMFS